MREVRGCLLYTFTAILLLGLLSSCAATESVEPTPSHSNYSIGACSIVESEAIEAVIGAFSNAMEWSWWSQSPDQGIALCNYSAANSQAVLTFQASEASEVYMSTRNEGGVDCSERLSLGIEGAVGYLCAGGNQLGNATPPYIEATWQSTSIFTTRIGFDDSRYVPAIADVQVPLQNIVREMMETVTVDSFKPK